MTEKATFGHGTAETWIVGSAALIIVAAVGFLVRVGYSSFTNVSEKVDNLDRRFIAVEKTVDSVHMQVVDIPAIKLEQARLDIRLQNLEAEMRYRKHDEE
jgi:hypothetical protein